MCGRYTLTYPDAESLAEALGALLAPGAAEAYRVHYNVAPSTEQLIVRQRRDAPGLRELVAALWGLEAGEPRVGRAPSPINARSETVRKNPLFRTAFERGRCLVPATGFFEWTGAKNARRPIWFHPPGGGLIRMAGIYTSTPHRSDPGIRVRTFAILTVPANDLVAKVHDRMPAIIAEENVDRWLSAKADDALKLLAPSPREWLIDTAVTPRANRVEHDDPECLEPWQGESAEEEPAAEQLTLFGSKR
jgi:putative SOS response-associated peptidase YedK